MFAKSGDSCPTSPSDCNSACSLFKSAEWTQRRTEVLPGRGSERSLAVPLNRSGQLLKPLCVDVAQEQRNVDETVILLLLRHDESSLPLRKAACGFAFRPRLQRRRRLQLVHCQLGGARLAERRQLGLIQFPESFQPHLFDEESNPRPVSIAAIAVLIENPLDGLGDQVGLVGGNEVFQEVAYAGRRPHSTAHVDAESPRAAALPSNKAQVVDCRAGSNPSRSRKTRSCTFAEVETKADRQGGTPSRQSRRAWRQKPRWRRRPRRNSPRCCAPYCRRHPWWKGPQRAARPVLDGYPSEGRDGFGCLVAS